MSDQAAPHHGCLQHRRRQQTSGFAGVAIVDGISYVTRMTREGNIDERERRVAA